MLFNSLTFVLFYFVVYILYINLRHRFQNYLLLVASYVFYACWDWRFLSLLFISTLIDYIAGIKIEAANSVRRRRVFLVVSMCSNLGILFFFKYFNFFADNAFWMCKILGFDPDPITLNIVLPVGVSFYTFQSMSYAIDIYRGHLKPTHQFLDFALYVSFFPQLVVSPAQSQGFCLNGLNTRVWGFRGFLRLIRRLWR